MGQCKKLVSYGDWGRTKSCARNAKLDGYCKQHHPDTVKARREESLRKDNAVREEWIQKRNKAQGDKRKLQAFTNALSEIAGGKITDPVAYAKGYLDTYLGL